MKNPGNACFAEHPERRQGERMARYLLICFGLVIATVPAVYAAAEDEEAAGIKQAIAELQKRLEAVEQKQKADAAAHPVMPANKEAQIQLDGRLFAGVFKTQKGGSFSNRSLDIPDSKIRFTMNPSKYVSVVNRFSTSRASTTGGFDYFYVDIKDWNGLAPGHTLRIGKHKIDVGQETWTDNPIESILVTNAISHISGYDEGINFRGPLTRSALPATYSIELLNGNRGFVASDSGLAWAAKVGVPATSQLYFSASYFRSGNLVKRDGTPDQPDFNIAEVFDAPKGATGWKRKLWEADARYGYGKEGILSTVGSKPDLPWQVAVAYGQFTDDATGAADREGKYWFAEALYNFTPTTYLALRYSEVSLDNAARAKLGGNSIEVNAYRRFAVGVGYRLSRLTHLRAEYTRNSTSGGTPEPGLDQVAFGVATKF